MNPEQIKDQVKKKGICVITRGWRFKQPPTEQGGSIPPRLPRSGEGHGSTP